MHRVHSGGSLVPVLPLYTKGQISLAKAASYSLEKFFASSLLEIGLACWWGLQLGGWKTRHHFPKSLTPRVNI